MMEESSAVKFEDAVNTDVKEVEINSDENNESPVQTTSEIKSSEKVSPANSPETDDSPESTTNKRKVSTVNLEDFYEDEIVPPPKRFRGPTLIIIDGSCILNEENIRKIGEKIGIPEEERSNFNFYEVMQERGEKLVEVKFLELKKPSNVVSDPETTE